MRMEYMRTTFCVCNQHIRASLISSRYRAGPLENCYLHRSASNIPLTLMLIPASPRLMATIVLAASFTHWNSCENTNVKHHEHRTICMNLMRTLLAFTI